MSASMVKVKVSDVIDAAIKVIDNPNSNGTMRRLAKTLRRMAEVSGDGHVFLSYGDVELLFMGYYVFPAIR